MLPGSLRPLGSRVAVVQLHSKGKVFAVGLVFLPSTGHRRGHSQPKGLAFGWYGPTVESNCLRFTAHGASVCSKFQQLLPQLRLPSGAHSKSGETPGKGFSDFVLKRIAGAAGAKKQRRCGVSDGPAQKLQRQKGIKHNAEGSTQQSVGFRGGADGAPKATKGIGYEHIEVEPKLG